ncbi:MAG: prepilin-type N-terminal cleavage/methylation domain-containing protein [Candidatus Falkowbacteria bacterium]|nr:prepilin-type N-terminal cleavage/methylation domain-containing protein [Candidatus Falkowbacteria bacterium]
MITGNQKNGFTLIELMLYVAISSVILLLTSLFLSMLLESRVKNQTIAEVEQQGVQVMQIVTQTIRNANAMGTPANGATSTSLSINTILASTTPTLFDLSGGVVRIKEGTGAVIPLTNSDVTVTGLTFYNLSRASTPGIIKISFTISSLNPANRNEYSFSKFFTGAAAVRQ